MVKNTPELRFKGFSDEWEQRKLSEGTAKIGDGLHGTPSYSEDGNVFFINGNNLVNGKIMITKETKFVTESDQSKDDKSLNTNTILMSINGTIGNLAWYNNEKVMLGKSAAYLTVSDFDKKFVYSYLQTASIKTYFMNNLTGTTIKNLGLKTIRDTKLFVPNLDEQIQIGSFFKQLDNTITLHQRKLDLLKQLKQAYLQKIFPKNGEDKPEIRFTEFKENWEQRKLGEIATMNARIGWQNLRTSEFLENGDYMLITGTDFKDGAIDYSNIHYVEKERFEQDKKIQISNGSILITKDGTLGKVAYVEDLTIPATLNAGVFNVRVKENLVVDRKYLFHYLKAPFLLKFADQRSTGGTIKHLNQNVLVEFPIPLPRLEEQHKVAVLLSSLETTITLHQSKLDQLKLLKSAFLQKMFI
ncbi:restriction endonuclease subunit S [Enterococcus devriesei]|uniref:restriction endonuclease subunit S n=1 Tax=Enterococcus devriesei TaxID=319970 RepID=UPI00289294E3|nr:restriction endonuclease subunit S [Enterococcus devriesei]MDT2822382.1 restriction endonuclease subunit S [Enterococcus devriesei]